MQVPAYVPHPGVILIDFARQSNELDREPVFNDAHRRCGTKKNADTLPRPYSSGRFVSAVAIKCFLASSALSHCAMFDNVINK